MPGPRKVSRAWHGPAKKMIVVEAIIKLNTAFIVLNMMIEIIA
jgi:hypothetical protein